MTSSSASSPSLNRYVLRSPKFEDDVATAAAAARFNPLFIHTASNAAHNHKHKLHSTSSISHNPTSSIRSNSNNSITSSNIVPPEERSISHSKSTANTSSNSMQPGAPATSSRKVHVVYYLSRSGQLEHPHLLEVSIPPNQGLYLRDVKQRLAVIRGKRLPSTFAWSYKRSYKNGYVWQDLCDDDLIFPAHGCEYVLKGSEILNDQRSSAEEESGQANADARSVIQSDGKKEPQALISRDPSVVFYEESVQAVSTNSTRVSNMVESGTDATTQTEEELRPSTDDDLNDAQMKLSKGLHAKHEGLQELAKHTSNLSPQRGSCTSTRLQNAIELNKAEIASPPSSSSATNSPSPYKEIASTSSSSTSIGNRSGEHVSHATELINSGSKTPGRPWMKKALQKLEEQGVILPMRKTDNGRETGESAVAATNESASSKVKHRSMASNSVASVIMEETEQSPAGHVRPSRGKHSSALSLLQFMSCGGLDIKEQILPMSLYRLRSKGTPGTASQLHMSNYTLSPEHSDVESFVTYGGSESSKSWGKFGKPKSLCLNGSGSKSILKLSGEFMNGESDAKNQHGQYHQYVHSMQMDSMSSASNGSSAKALGVSIPDVISIGRLSISDRSTSASHELEYHTSYVNARPKRSGEVANSSNSAIKGSLRLEDARPEALADVCNHGGTRPTMGTLSARAVSGEILMSKGSPIFVPGKRHLSYSGTPLNYVGSGIKPMSHSISISPRQAHHDAGNNALSANQDTDNKSTICSGRSCNPSRAFSDGEVSCMLANRNAVSKLGEQRLVTINGYDQSMAQLWEELLAAPTSMAEEHQQKDGGDFRRVRQVTMGSSSAWDVERTLQNAVELSLQPPLEHHLLHVDCPHCGRKVKTEQMKAHLKSCSSPKSPSFSSTASSAAPPAPNTTHSISSCGTTKPSSHNHVMNGCGLSLNGANLNSFGKSAKSDSNLCQRFLRASPPPCTTTKL